jgi:hypothetical protein
MVKEEKVKRQKNSLKVKQAINCKLLAITDFTGFLNSKRNILMRQFSISSRSIGVPYSQKKNKKRIISQKRKRIKEQF